LSAYFSVNNTLALTAFFLAAQHAHATLSEAWDAVGKAKLRGPARLKAMYGLRQQHWITQENLKDRPAFIVEAVRTLDEQIPKRIEEAKAATGNVRDQLLTLVECMMQWQDIFLLHRKDDRKAVEKWKTTKGRKDLRKQIDGRLEVFEDDPRLFKKLQSNLVKICTRSVELDIPKSSEPAPEWLAQMLDNDTAPPDDVADWHCWTSMPEIPAANILLVGSEGTGKSDFLKIIKDVLGIPGESLTVPSMLKGGVEDLLAKTWDATRQVKYITNEPDLLGKLGLILIRLACENGYINIDEPNWEDTAGLKRLLDPWKDTIEAACLRTAFKWMRITRIISTNNVPKSAGVRTVEEIYAEIDGPIDDRMDTALFKENSWEAKRKAAKKAYWRFASLFCLPVKGGDGPVLNEDQQMQMQRVFRAVLDKIADWHHHKAPGRRLDVPVEYIVNRIYLRLQKLEMESTECKPQLDIEDIWEDVRDAYEPRPDRNPYSDAQRAVKAREPYRPPAQTPSVSNVIAPA
jgi:hypothetical protein